MRYGICVSICMALMLGACGGSSGGDGGTTPPVVTHPGSVTFNAAKSVGDLVTYTLNPAGGTYTWVGVQPVDPGGGGTMTPIPGWGSYVYDLSGTDGECVLLPNKLALVEDDAGALYAGVPQLTTNYNSAAIQGMYNYVGWDNGSEEFDYGTFEITATNWYAWSTQNGTVAGQGAADDTGTWTDNGNGVITAMQGPTHVANVLLRPAGNETLLVVDLVADPGMYFGVRQRALPAGIDGVYDVLASDADNLYSVTVSGTTVLTDEGPATIQLNTPWAGFAYNNTVYGAGDEDFNYLIASPDGLFFGGGWATAPDPGEDPEYIWAAIRR